jgi:hypothetical protein
MEKPDFFATHLLSLSTALPCGKAAAQAARGTAIAFLGQSQPPQSRFQFRCSGTARTGFFVCRIDCSLSETGMSERLHTLSLTLWGAGYGLCLGVCSGVLLGAGYGALQGDVSLVLAGGLLGGAFLAFDGALCAVIIGTVEHLARRSVLRNQPIPVYPPPAEGTGSQQGRPASAGGNRAEAPHLLQGKVYRTALPEPDRLRSSRDNAPTPEVRCQLRSCDANPRVGEPNPAPLLHFQLSLSE